MSNKMIINAVSAVLALGLSSTSLPALAENMASSPESGQDMMLSPPPQGMERCYGIAKAGQNNCGNAIHGCSGEATVSGDKSDWMFVPTGLCNKIVGGSLKPEKKS